MLIPGDHAPFGIREAALALFLLEGLEKLGTVHCHAAYYTISAALATGYLTVVSAKSFREKFKSIRERNPIEDESEIK